MLKAIGVIGLGVMGRNLALNLANQGYAVAGYDLSEKQRSESEIAFAGLPLTVHDEPRSFINDLSTPRKILIMVPAGKPVEAVITEVTPLLQTGDILIDGDPVARASRETFLARFGMLFQGGALFEIGRAHV